MPPYKSHTDCKGHSALSSRLGVEWSLSCRLPTFRVKIKFKVYLSLTKMCEKASPVGVYVLQLRFFVGSLSAVDPV